MKYYECKHYKHPGRCKDFRCDCRLWGTLNQFCAGFVKKKDKMTIEKRRKKLVCKVCKIPFSEALYFVYNICEKCIETEKFNSTGVIKETVCPTCGGYCARNGEFYYCHEEFCKQLPFKGKIRWRKTIDLGTGEVKKVKIYDDRHY